MTTPSFREHNGSPKPPDRGRPNRGLEVPQPSPDGRPAKGPVPATSPPSPAPDNSGRGPNIIDARPHAKPQGPLESLDQLLSACHSQSFPLLQFCLILLELELP